MLTALCLSLLLAGCASSSFVASNATVGVAQPGPAPPRFFKVPPGGAASPRISAVHPVSAPAATSADHSAVEVPVEPDCEYRGQMGNPPSAEEIRIKLDYEQQCHRQSEMILRTRLQQLQEAVNGASAAQEPEPDCAFKGPLSNPATVEQIRTKLQYEMQCYRQAEADVRARIRQLQSSTTGRK